MPKCTACNQGQRAEQLIDTCFRWGERWVLFRNVPAQVCDLCGDKEMSQEVAERLAELANPASGITPTNFLYTPVMDLEELKKAWGRGELPVVSTETTEPTTLDANEPMKEQIDIETLVYTYA